MNDVKIKDAAIRKMAKTLVEDYDNLPCNYEEHPECTGEGKMDCIQCLIDSIIKEVRGNQ